MNSRDVRRRQQHDRRRHPPTPGGGRVHVGEDRRAPRRWRPGWGGDVDAFAYSNYGRAGGDRSVTITDPLPAGFTFSELRRRQLVQQHQRHHDLERRHRRSKRERLVTVTATATNPFTAPNPATNNASINWTQNTGAPIAASAHVGITGNACSTYYFRKTTAKPGGGEGTKQIATQAATAPTDNGATTIVSGGNNASGFVTALEFYKDPANLGTVMFNSNITTNIYLDRANGPGRNRRPRSTTSTPLRARSPPSAYTVRSRWKAAPRGWCATAATIRPRSMPPAPGRKTTGCYSARAYGRRTRRLTRSISSTMAARSPIRSATAPPTRRPTDSSASHRPPT